MRERKNLFIGIIGMLLLFYGELLPSFFNEWSIFIIESINESILLLDSGLLIISSFAYIAKYLIIFSLIYLGSMMIAHSLSKDLEQSSFPLLLIVTVMASLFLFNQIYHEHFSYLGHIVTLGIVVFLQIYIPKQKNFYIIFSIILFLVILSVQWLQLIPVLSSLGFGTDDIAISLKMADSFFTENNLFNTLATIFFIAFFIIAIIFTFLIHLVNKQVYTLKKYQEQEEELKETRIALVESKVYEEMTMLVHDLKTPLVTVEGLLSLIEMKMQLSEDRPLATYLKRTDKSIEIMKDMISEILYENIKQPIHIKELLEYVTSHLNLDEQFIDLDIKMEPNLPQIYVNKTRFSRAISNILENAVTSLAGKEGYIHINVKRIDSDILFQIQDNGPGIKNSHLKNIWIDGFSTRNSSGIGLSFVKRVVENHEGTVTVDSVPGSHTQMNILLPIHKVGEQTNEYIHTNR
ncbi:sensor histidine kinase [Virgibacillus byunsanensis]|uniref:histidine kinase n=1 Tax=Virgibacillus byunsanensis TaxID=570945 RepID=A0ABW3LLD6_9BACI